MRRLTAARGYKVANQNTYYEAGHGATALLHYARQVESQIIPADSKMYLAYVWWRKLGLRNLVQDFCGFPFPPLERE